MVKPTPLKHNRDSKQHTHTHKLCSGAKALEERTQALYRSKQTAQDIH
jgi:hypothetical protein